MLKFDKKFTCMIDDRQVEFEYADYKGYDVVMAPDVDMIALTGFSVHKPSRPTIFISSPFFELDDICQEFILNHEIGHIKLNHVSPPMDQSVNQTINSAEVNEFMDNYSTNRLHSDLDAREVEADSFSAKEIGYDYAIHGLKGILQYYENRLLSVSTSYESVDVNIVRESVKLTIRELIQRLNILTRESVSDGRISYAK